jgi:diaminohydroxyphosphoribosylaminopyrimidine deaminase/5-amino-6-(5-phosphoribosylamino)uracil reductase
MSRPFENPEAVMRRALELAAQGLGHVEPNPAVGAVLVDHDLQLIAEGWHERFGGPHAEINALNQAGPRSRGATLFVTLEPCSHHGKTPPCAPAVVAAGVRKVVAAMLDPSPQVSGGGVRILREAGVGVEVGLLAAEARRLTAPFAKLTGTSTPYVHAKWAMSLDGRIATRSGDSKWISSEESRALVHRLRGRMDAIVAGIGTVLADDPLLTARPPGPRVATRIILDGSARLPLDSQLVRTAAAAPVIAAVAESAPADRCARLADCGVDVVRLPVVSGAPAGVSLSALLRQLGQRSMSNVLVEGGGRVLGTFFDAGLIDEFHVFIAPRLIGGAQAPGPLQGRGTERLAAAVMLEALEVRSVGGDLYVNTCARRGDAAGN